MAEIVAVPSVCVLRTLTIDIVKRKQFTSVVFRCVVVLTRTSSAISAEGH